MTKQPVSRKLMSLKADERTRRELVELGVNEEDIYDHTPASDDIYGVPTMDGLSKAEIEDAKIWRRYYRGTMMVTGARGSGKGLFLMFLFEKMKRLFGRRIMLDYKPREAFGPYIPFDDNIFLGELAKMGEVATQGTSDERMKRLKKMKRAEIDTLTSQWLADKGEVLLQGAALGLDELKRYLHNRRPHSPMGILIGHLNTIVRHTDLLLVGMTPFANEIDEKGWMQYVTHRVQCSWGKDGRAWCDIYQTEYHTRSGILRVRGPRFTVAINGSKARPELGGLRLYDLYNSKDPKVLKPDKSLVRMVKD